MGFLDKFLGKKTPVAEKVKNDEEKQEPHQETGELNPEVSEALNELKAEGDDLVKVFDNMGPEAVADKVKKDPKIAGKIFNAVNIIAKVGAGVALLSGPAAFIIDRLAGTNLAEHLIGVSDIPGVEGIDKVHMDALIIKDFAILVGAFLINIPGMIYEANQDRLAKEALMKEGKERREQAKARIAAMGQDQEFENIKTASEQTAAEELEKVRKEIAA